MKLRVAITVPVLACALAAVAPAAGTTYLASQPNPDGACTPSMQDGGVAARGGSGREPDLGQTPEDLPRPRKAKPNGASRPLAGVRARGDRRRDRGDHGRRDRRTDRRAEQHVRRWRGRCGDRLDFTLAGVTHTDDASWFYANPGGTREHSMKQALRQGGPTR